MAFLPGCHYPLRFLVILLVHVLLLGVGCAPKVVIQSPEPPPPADTGPVSSVSGILMAEYQAWKGVPHRVGGTDRRGVDCSGLVQAVFRDGFQLELPRKSIDQSHLGQPVDRSAMLPGDLLFFLDKGGDHIGVLVMGRQFLHSSTSQGVVISELDNYWNPRLLRVRRILPK